MGSEIGLIILAFFTSALTAVTAAGGGMLLISAMVLFLPVHIVIPLHAVTQLASNFSRAAFSPASILWRITLPFICGVCLGFPAATDIYSTYKTTFSALPLGMFVLFMVWIPPGKLSRLVKAKVPAIAGKGAGSPLISLKKIGFAILGFIQIFVTLFVGSSAPLNMPFLIQQQIRREELIATSAMMMTWVSLAKIIIFIQTGFGFSGYTWLILGLILAVSGGSWFGTRVRQHIPEQMFARMLKVVLTILAIRMLVTSLVQVN